MVQGVIFQYIGSFGRFQKWILFIMSIPWVFCAIQTCLSVFILFTPEHRCSHPEHGNKTLTTQQYATYTDNIPAVRMQGVDVSEEEGYIYSRCEVYKEAEPSNNTLRYEEHYLLNTTIYKFECRRWSYDKNEVDQSFVTKHNLVCRKKLHRTHAMTSFMGGFTIGSLSIGIISDTFGRKIALILGVLIHIISNVSVSFVNEFVEFVVMRFFSGVSVAGLLNTAYVIAIEYVGPEKRMLAGMLMQCTWGFGAILLAGIAYFIRNWRYLNLAVSIPPVFLLSYIWLVPESVTWLVAKGKTEEASKVIRHIAKVNKVQIPNNVLKAEITPASQDVSGFAFGNFKFILQTIIICLNWMVVSMEFTGLSLYAGNLTGNIYFNFLLLSLAELSGFIICIPLLNRVGRKPVYLVSLLVAAAALLLTMFPVLFPSNDSAWLVPCLSILGKIGASAAFGTIFLYTAEFFPTSMRNSSIGLCSLCARVGGMISPYIVDLGFIVDGDIGKALPTVVFGGTSFVVGILALCLTDTLDKDVTDLDLEIHKPLNTVETVYKETDEEKPLKQDDNDETKGLQCDIV